MHLRCCSWLALDAIHAGVLLVKLEQLDKIGDLRRRSADLYMHHLRALGCDAVLDLPMTLEYNAVHVHAQFIVALNECAFKRV